MIARKGVDLLLQAFARLDARARLLLVGREADLPGWLAALPAERARAAWSTRASRPPEALPRFFARADVFVLPSRYDGWGVVVNQALGAGLPILCSDAVGAAADLVRAGGEWPRAARRRCRRARRRHAPAGGGAGDARGLERASRAARRALDSGGRSGQMGRGVRTGITRMNLLRLLPA